MATLLVSMASGHGTYITDDNMSKAIGNKKEDEEIVDRQTHRSK